MTPVAWQAAHVYESKRADAQRRMRARDLDDWPTVALALARSLPIWSQDRDLEVSGVRTFTTGELLDATREAGGELEDRRE